jgi:hypothetical protein
LTSEKKPAFGSGDEALAVPFVSVGFCQLLFGNGAVALFVGIRCGAISSDMKLSSQAARSIG